MDDSIDLDKVNSIKVGQQMWYRGQDPGKVVKVNKVENQFGTVLLDFEVLWDGNAKSHTYQVDNVHPNLISLERKRK